jgi:hypothetical protein
VSLEVTNPSGQFLELDLCQASERIVGEVGGKAQKFLASAYLEEFPAGKTAGGSRIFEKVQK